MSKPLISICLPTSDMDNKDFFLERCLKSIKEQKFTDYELVITNKGKMAENTNSAIKKAKGKIIKILFMDDYFYSNDALENIANNFKEGWLATGCIHDNHMDVLNPHVPTWNSEIYKGFNTIGSPSVVCFENNEPLLFDEKLSWMLDCDLYWRLFMRYGLPTLLDSIDIAIGIGTHQTTYTMMLEEKLREQKLVTKRYTL